MQLFSNGFAFSLWFTVTGQANFRWKQTNKWKWYGQDSHSSEPICSLYCNVLTPRTRLIRCHHLRLSFFVRSPWTTYQSCTIAKFDCCYDMLFVVCLRLWCTCTWTTEAIWSHSFKRFRFLLGKFDTKFEGYLLIRGGCLKLGMDRWSGFRVSTLQRHISETVIELRSQSITNRKLYVSFRFMQKSVTLNDLEPSKCSN